MHSTPVSAEVALFVYAEIQVGYSDGRENPPTTGELTLC